MKVFKKTFLLLLAIFAFNTTSYAQLNIIMVKNADGAAINYRFNDRQKNTVRVAKGDYQGKIVIPSTIEHDGKTLAVTKMDYNAFKDCKDLKSLEIPNSIKEIEAYAFNGCIGLTSVSISDSTTEIGKGAFTECVNLTKPIYNSSIFVRMPTKFYGEFSIPEGIHTISSEAFSGCESLLSINIPNTVTKIGDYAFKKCKNLKSLSIPNSVTHVGECICDGCYYITQPIHNNTTFIYMPEVKGTYQIPNGIKTIAGGAFSHSKLSSIKLPNSVDSISPVHSSIATTFSDTYLTTPVYNKTIFAKMSRGFKGEYKIPKGIKIISEEAFGSFDSNMSSDGFKNLTFVEIPKSVTKIQPGAFRYCTGLVKPLLTETVFLRLPTKYYGEYIIPKGITRIDEGAFENCNNMTSIVIPNSVEQIGNSAFWGCNELKEITIESPQPPVTYFINNVPADCILKVPADAINAYKSSRWNSFKNIVAIK